MVRERILVTVRTYPALSARYLELVCTGGITDHLEWRRLVPVPLRYLDDEQQYKTYDVVEVDVDPGKDSRPETRTPRLPGLRIVGRFHKWADRCEWVNPTILPSLQALQDAGRTLAPVVVSEVVEFTARRAPSEWRPEQLERIKQVHLFDEPKPLEKIPFDFRFRWKDGDRIEHNSMVLAWEFGQTWRQYRNRYDDPIKKMREKWLTDICGANRQVAFFMGNLAKRRNVFAVCGVFGPPKEVARNGGLWSETDEA